MEYSGLLTADEVKRFISHFYEIESAKTTEVRVRPDLGSNRSKYLVVLKSESIVEDLLDASFRDGMLNHWGWSKKFQKDSIK